MSSYPQSTSPPHWESRNGYVPPPRFQQLRAQDYQLHSQLNQHADPNGTQRQYPLSANPPLANIAPSPNTYNHQGHFTPSPNQSPRMAHARSSSYFSFARKQSADAQSGAVQQRPLSSAPNTNGSINSNQFLPPSTNAFSQDSTPGSSRQTPTYLSGSSQDQQSPQFAQSQGPPFSPAPAPQQGIQPMPVVPQQVPQRPQVQPQQSSNTEMAPTAGGSQQPTPTNATSVPDKPQPPQVAPAPLHPEIRSVVQLSIAHAHKVYFSGPLVRRYERQPDGQKPHKDEGWVDVWAQLGGTTLSIWSMKEIQEASKQGKEVPPSYINVTDAFIQVLGSVTVQPTATTPGKRYTNVLTLNTAGSNLLLFSCPSTPALISWAAALRLAAWEKSRLEEIYTAHLIRITLTARDVPTTLIRGKMEGYARVRIAGQTDWKRVWLVVQEGSEGVDHAATSAAANAVQSTMKKKRMSNLFSREQNVANFPVPTRATVSFYAGPKPKDRKKPLLTVHSVTQAFGVYPERPELINRSTLIKIEGTLGDDDIAGTLRGREAWVLIMPELENGVGQAAEMLKWVVALHDAFELYGRPDAWTWDPRDPVSLMFGYPVGPQKENLFMDREVVENMDPRDDRTSAIRTEMKRLLLANMKPAVQVVQPRPTQRLVSDSPPILPAIGANVVADNDKPQSSTLPTPDASAPKSPTGLQLPPLDLGSETSFSTPSRSGPLTPITERTLSADLPGQHTPSPSPLNDQVQRQGSNPATIIPKEKLPLDVSSPEPAPILSGPISLSPRIGSPTIGDTTPNPPQSIPQSPNDSRPISALDKPPSSTYFDHKSPANATSPKSVTSPKLQDRVPSDGPSPAYSPLPSPNLANPNASQLSPNLNQAFPASFLSANSNTNVSSNRSSATSPEPSSDNDQSRLGARSALASPVLSSKPQSPVSNTFKSTPAEEPNDFINEAGAALFYMRQNEAGNKNVDGQQRQQRPSQQTRLEEESSSNEESDDAPKGRNVSRPPPQTNENPGRTSTSPDIQPIPSRRGTPMAFAENNSNSPPNSAVTRGRLSSPTRSGLGRKPSGARAQSSATRSFDHRGAGSISSQTVTEEDENMSHNKENTTSDLAYDDATGEALAALTYLDIADQEAEPARPSTRQPTQTVEPLKIRSDRTNNASSPPPMSSGDNVPYRSSFAPSNKAAERKLKAQAQQAAHHAATHKPGRANGKKKANTGGAWESSDEEEEEEEEEEDDDDEPASGSERPTARGYPSNSMQQGLSTAGSLKPLQTQQLQDYQQQDGVQTPSHLRPARNLPEIPGNRGPGDGFYHPQPQLAQRRMVSDSQYSADGGRRTHYDDGTPIRTQAEVPQPGAARQTVWSQVLDPGRSGRIPQPEQTPGRDTFVQLEPSEAMTKAFTPQGLLSAGLQDKEDRSARRQEELARESGASLINVPNKPPPPQTGLLGAITAHERERKRDGGVGAALTEREREKRLAEERQRRFDEHQRQQLDQMQQGGSMYGGFGFNPMMANPMMMGMNPMMGLSPMMTGNGMNPMMGAGGMPGMNPMMTGQMGYPGMMGGFNPQHMFAAQQAAAQAYQQAMMAFSVAGSQIGGEGGAAGTGGGAVPQVTPNLTGNMGGMNLAMSGMNPAMGANNMGAFDPRMSMMGMPMMGMGMGMMGMGAPPTGPLGMQGTGMSNFDPRSSPGLTNSGQQNSNEAGLVPPNQFSSRTSSPASRGSPLARGGPEVTADRGRPSRPTSPK
ncbi:hypothetical protein D9613_007907 [Agrocybe pediades]|uniref:PH domain-containing protein n=1 Tax=Agrocybe pediades TaxID=84607 RepID=A0A8H4QN56_9AGAR|nr:hypothetical protein D9613_007907 [Agrocybe pediades]